MSNGPPEFYSETSCRSGPQEEFNDSDGNKNPVVEEYETNLMSLVIKFYSTSSMLNMFRTLIHPSSGACDFPIVSQASACHTVTTPT